MSFYSWAFNDPDDPLWACFYGVETHPLYHQCDKCPSFDKCTQPAKFFKVVADDGELPPDCVGNCLDCRLYTVMNCPYLNRDK